MLKRKNKTPPFFETATFVKSFKKLRWEVKIYEKDTFFIFYYYEKEIHKNKPWICIGKIRAWENKEITKKFLLFEDYLKHYYKWDFLEEWWLKNISFPDFKRFVYQLTKWNIKSIKDFQESFSYLKWKSFREIVGLNQWI